MENLGVYLQKLREEKGISYQKVFEDLRLREEQVHLIEENRFFELGHFGFTKALVHRYARYLEADLDEVMAELRVMVPENAVKPALVDRDHPLCGDLGGDPLACPQSGLAEDTGLPEAGSGGHHCGFQSPAAQTGEAKTGTRPHA